MRRGGSLIGLFALALASPALAEVSDKIPTLSGLWGWALLFNGAGLVLSLRRPALGLIVLPFAGLMAWANHGMVADPYLGPAILAEQGAGYVRAAYASAAIGLAGPVVTAALAWWFRRRQGSTGKD